MCLERNSNIVKVIPNYQSNYCLPHLINAATLPYKMNAILDDLKHSLTRSSATAEIARDVDDVVQSHSRSSVVPINTAYMTSY